MADVKKDQRASGNERHSGWTFNKTERYTWQQNGWWAKRISEQVEKQNNPEYSTDQKMAHTSGGRAGSMGNVVRQAHACMTRGPEGQGKMQNRKYLTRSWAEDFPKPVEYPNPQIQEVKIIPNRKNTKKYLEKPTETVENQRQWKYFKRN